MAAAGRAGSRSTSLTVAVVGVTSSSFLGETDQGEGAGKSCLCNRFIWPHSDQYYDNHPYIVNHSEYGNSIINSTHFLYWGEKQTSLEDASEVSFKVIEHTEFVEDMSLKPFPSQKAYHKRIAVTKLQSSGKLQYVAPNQLTLPEEYTSVSRFPDRNVQVDGFILCIDSSAPFDPKDIRYKIAEKLITSIHSTKKPLVVALTKCDVSTQTDIHSIMESLSKLKKVPQVIEVSSHEGVNVDLCFHSLVHLIDSRKPKTRLVSFEESYFQVKQRTRQSETDFKEMLSSKLTDFTIPHLKAYEIAKAEPEYHPVARFKGESRCKRLIELRLAELLEKQIDKQSEIFLEMLPQALNVLLPSVSLTDTYEMCVELIKQHSEHLEYFIEVKGDWREDKDFLFSFPTKIPISIIEKEGKGCLEGYISRLQLEEKKTLAQIKIKEVLESCNDLQPGLKAMVAMDKLGLRESAELLSADLLQNIYHERMTVVEQQCSVDIHELLLERLDLFHDYTPGAKELIDKLQDEPRMKKMESAPVKRDGILIKHISNLEVLDHGPYFTPDIVSSLASASSSIDSYKSNRDSNWWLDEREDGEPFGLAIIAMTSDEAITLRSDIMNSCGGSDLYEAERKSYKLDMMCFSGALNSFSTGEFIPQGAVFVVTSIESLDWLKTLYSTHLVSSSSSLAKYRSLPCVVLVVDVESSDGNSNSDLYNQAKSLANSLQCVIVVTRPSTLPGRLITQEPTDHLLSSLFDSVSLTTRFIKEGPKLEEDGLNFCLFSFPGDPIDIPGLTNSLYNQQQLSHYDSSKKLLYMKIALEKQHRIATMSLSSTINSNDFRSHPLLGFIILYSAQRKASLAAVKWLLPRLFDIPILLIAMTTDEQAPLVEEGEKLSKDSRKKMKFVVCQNILEIGHISEFVSSCFFSRFTTWKSQSLSEEVVQRLCKRKARQLPQAQPINRSSYSSSTLPHNLSRHSIAISGDEIRTFDRQSFKSPARAPLTNHLSRNLSMEEEEDPMYTSPADIKMPFSPSHGPAGLPSSTSRSHHLSTVFTTPERKISNPESSLSRSGPMTQFNSLPRNPHHQLPDYVVVPDSEALNKLDTLKRQYKGMSGGESPLGVRGVKEGSSDSLVDECLYADPRETSPAHSPAPSPAKKHSQSSLASSFTQAPPPPIPPREKLYDHLTPRSKRRLQEKGIDISEAHLLAEPESLYSFAEGPPIEGRTSPVLDVGTPQLGMYDMVGESGASLYSLAGEAEVSDINSYPRGGTNLTPPTQDVYSYTTVSGREETPEALYAEPTIPRNWSPSPSPERLVPPSRPPKPLKSAKVLNTKMASKPSRAGTVKEKSPPMQQVAPPVPRRGTSPNLIRHVVPDEDNPSLIYAIPTKQTKTSPKISRNFHEATPPSGDDSNIYAIPHKLTKTSPKVSHTFHEATPPSGDYEEEEEDDDEAPPLPERNYNWSDIEDDDEDILCSDDELSSQSSDALTSTGSTPSPVGMYATVSEMKGPKAASSTLSPPPDVYRCSKEIEEMEVIYMNFNQLRQLSNKYPQESIYDSLEKVTASISSNPSIVTHLPTTTMNTIPKMPTLSKNALKLMKSMEKKSQREAERRRRKEAKRRKKEEEEARKNQKALKKGKKVKSKAQRKRYFESPLSSVVEEDGVPKLVKACAEFIEKEGLTAEGIYRVSGKKEDIMIFQEKYDQDPSIPIEDANLCVNTISGIMKNFFKLLPDPLIPESVLPDLLDIPGRDPQAQKQRMQEVLSKLPKDNIATLTALVRHLHVVQLHHDVNKMTASNLSIVFWPTLMRPPLMDLANPEKQLGFQLTMSKLIENPDFVPEIK